MFTHATFALHVECIRADRNTSADFAEYGD
jgi:hypothetical protein